jgi:hypothetical protein
MFAEKSRVLMPLGLCVLLSPSAVQAVPPKPATAELQVFLGDKPVGTEALRVTTTKEGTYYSTQAHLQDKVNKLWRSFTERGYLPIGPKGELTGYDRWIDVTGATGTTKLFNFNGQWRIAVTEAAIDGKKPKPKVVDVKLKVPFVVLDERMQSMVLVAAERMAGVKEFDYVRVDDATTGHLTLSSEKLKSKDGAEFHRIRMKGGPAPQAGKTQAQVDLEVLRDHAGHVVAIKGLDKWRAVAKDVKVPRDLTPAGNAPVDKPVETPAPIEPPAVTQPPAPEGKPAVQEPPPAKAPVQPPVAPK